MRPYFFFLLSCLYLLPACTPDPPTVYHYQEIPFPWSSLREVYDAEQTWFRTPERIAEAHATLKCIGYENVLEYYGWWDEPLWYFGHSRPLNVMIDSLVVAYRDSLGVPEYFRAFWRRRMAEGTDSVAFRVLLEVQEIRDLNGRTPPRVGPCRDTLVNDTLRRLLEMEYLNQPGSVDGYTKQDIDYLISVGMYGSAYNLLRERYGNTHDLTVAEWEERMRRLKQDSVERTEWFWDVEAYYESY